MSKANVIADHPDEECNALEAELRDKLYEVVDSLKGLLSNMRAMTSVAPSLAYEEEVEHIFRSYAQSGWLTGTIHTTNRLRRESFLTHTDITSIKQISLEHGQRFWARVERGVIQKEMEAKFIPDPNDTPTDSQSEAEHYSNEWIVDAVASSCIYSAYNQAIKSKASKF